MRSRWALVYTYVCLTDRLLYPTVGIVGPVRRGNAILWSGLALGAGLRFVCLRLSRCLEPLYSLLAPFTLR